MILIEKLNTLPYHYYYLCFDSFLDVLIPNLTNFTSISQDNLQITDHLDNSGQLLNHPQTIQFIKEHTPTGITPVIIPFKPSAKIKLICHKNNWIYAANPPEINRRLEDKIFFQNHCDNFSIPTLPHLTTRFSHNTIEIAQAKLHSKDLVIQTRFGWAGKSTFASTDPDIFKKIEPDQEVKITPFTSGYTLINNCCQTKKGLLQSPPGLQYSGFPSLTSNPFTTVGRQWPAPVSQKIKEKIKLITRLFSNSLPKDYFGFFGLDFFVDQNESIYVLECNPRLTASFGFYTSIELSLNYDPLFTYHISQFINVDYELTDVFDDNKIIGSQINKKDIYGKTVATATFDKALIADVNLKDLPSNFLTDLEHVT